MRRVTADGPAVVGGRLEGVHNGPLAVGSPAWAAWLAADGAEHRAFTFPAAVPGELHRAYREWRNPAPWQPGYASPAATGAPDDREQPYWYVRVRIGGKSRRFYLGTPATLDGPRLVAVAVAITAARSAIGS